MKGGDEMDVDGFLCPITREVMRNPVIAADGHTYERASIERWFEQQRDGGVASFADDGCAASVTHLITNFALRKAIEAIVGSKPAGGEKVEKIAAVTPNSDTGSTSSHRRRLQKSLQKAQPSAPPCSPSKKQRWISFCACPRNAFCWLFLVAAVDGQSPRWRAKDALAVR